MEPVLFRWLSDCLSPSASQTISPGRARRPPPLQLSPIVAADDDPQPAPATVANTTSPLPLQLIAPRRLEYSSPSSLQEEREQALRDYKVTIEYKHLKSHAPGGVYLVPSLHSLREFYGIIFVRRGPYTNGIFKFRMTLPPQYNDVDTYPRIFFTSFVFNPHVNPESGELELRSAYPKWNPTQHYLVTVLTFLKKIFYAKNFAEAKGNVPAKELAVSDPDEYRNQVDMCVRESQKDVFVNMEDSTAKFTEEQLSHRVLRDLLKANVKDPGQVSKQTILSMIDKASNV